MSDNVYVKAFAVMKAEVWFNDNTTVAELIHSLSHIDPRATVSCVYRATPSAPNQKTYNIDFSLLLGEEEIGKR
jgi:hypothetical protein